MNELDFTNRTASILFRTKKSRIDCHFLSTKTPVPGQYSRLFASRTWDKNATFIYN